MVPGQAIVFSSPKTKRKALRLLGVPRPLASAGGPLPPSRGKPTRAAHGHDVLPEDASGGGIAPAGLHGSIVPQSGDLCRRVAATVSHRVPLFGTARRTAIAHER